MKRFIFLCVFLILAAGAVAAERPTDRPSATYAVLWDRVASNDSYSSSGNFKSVGEALQQMGATITPLTPSQRYSDEVLEGIDLVIIPGRNGLMLAEEQQALVRYVRNGGSLLVLIDWSPQQSSVNPVLTNFGIVITAARTGRTKLLAFENPATTPRRVVTVCHIYRAFQINCCAGARGIAGYNAAGPPAMSEIYAALGANCGRGRVVAVGDEEIWYSNDT